MLSEEPSGLSAVLEAGAVRVEFLVLGYLFSGSVSGPDADWLRERLLVRSPGLAVQRDFLTLAPTQPWADAVRGVLSGDTCAVLVNTEDDFKLSIKGDGGGLRIDLDVVNRQEPVLGRVTISFPATASSLATFHQSVEEMGWAFPSRSGDV